MNRILLIEDDAIDQNLAVHRLRESYQVDTASEFGEAAAKLVANTYDAILVDLKVPGVDMGDIVAEVKRICRGSAIIVLSGYGDDKTVRKAIHDNACQFLVKGVSDAPPGALVNLVATGINTHLACKRLDEAKDKIRL